MPTVIPIESFQKGTGRKTDNLITGQEGDHWLVLCVAALITALAVGFLYAAWKERRTTEVTVFALTSAFALQVDSWRIHRRIGMSGRLLLHALSDELDCQVTPDQAKQIDKRHGELFQQCAAKGRPLRGARELLKRLKEQSIPFGIATSGTRPDIDPSLECLGIGEDVVVIEGKSVSHPKPEPDVLLACQEKLDKPVKECFVVGDAIWDLLAAHRAGMFSIGLLSGGNGPQELFNAGAYRVFDDPAHLLESLYQLGIT